MTNGTDTAVAEPTDTRDMVVVHTALLREVRLAPDAVERAAGAGARRRNRVVRHVRIVLDVLDHHHGEDELLLPLLRARVPRESVPVLDTGEEQHARIEGLIADARAGLDRWAAGDDDAVPGLRDDLTALHGALEPHLRAEERNVLPLAATHLTAAEWGAIGETGSAAVPKPALVAVFGAFMYEGDPDVVRAMLAHAPAVPRLLLPLVAPGAYARHCRRVHGTARP